MKTQKKMIPGAALAAVFLTSLFSMLLSPVLSAQEAATPIKTLIVTGQNYHDWKTTSAVIKQILEDTDLFRVDITVSPPAKAKMSGFRPNFPAYGLVVLDYSGDAWPAATQKAFVEYVKNGGGVVVYHSANNSFPEWPEYNEIIGLAGWGDRTEKAGPYVYWKDGRIVRDTEPGVCGYHGPEHPFLIVNRTPDHPITAGLPPRWMHAGDELYGLLRGPAKNLTVLATAYFAPEESGSGRDEPVLFTVNYGAGRVFHTVLGHARPEGPHPALECVGFIVTLQRGAEWAATGRVTQKVPADFPATSRDISTPEDVRRRPGYRPPSLEAILKDLDSFAYSRNEEVLYRLREYILNHRNAEEAQADSEERLLEFLDRSNNSGAKLAVCRQLRLIGSEKSVPTLEKLLLQDETSDMARYVLEKIPGPAADKALLDALNKAQDEVKLGIISSLGERKTPGAVKALALLLNDQETAIASASATSLGKIGGREAAAALAGAFDKAQESLKTDIASPLLRCAEEFLASRDYNSADGIFGKILNPQPPLLPVVLRQAALKGRIMAAEREEAARMIIDTLARGSQEMHEPAIGLVPIVFKESEIAPISDLLVKIPEAGQVQFLAVLVNYPKEAVQAAVLSAAKSPSPAVRIAALKALAKVGDAATVRFLVERAAGSRGEEQLAARAGLGTLPGKDIDKTVLFGLAGFPGESAKNELIRAVGERRITAGKNHLMTLAGSGSLQNSLEAVKALKAVASPTDIPALLDILLEMSDETAQEEMENTIAALARKVSDPYSRALAVEGLLAPLPNSKVLPVTDVKKRCLLYRTLGKIGDDSSLTLLRTALQEENAAIQDAVIRALADWPSATPREDVLAIAQRSKDLTHQVLALRGYVRMIGLEKYQSPAAAVQSLMIALNLAPRPEEIKLVLGTLPDFACPDALALAESLLSVERVQAEAEAAVTRIREFLEMQKKN
ncbi:MAG TPA: HEAT repeat domain-containing protein [Candidatus Desulfaltia sp.]|nr:HEAT repeat domain-containing protein [Candidatus Desulfaltia sp.]